MYYVIRMWNGLDNEWVTISQQPVCKAQARNIFNKLTHNRTICLKRLGSIIYYTLKKVKNG